MLGYKTADPDLPEYEQDSLLEFLADELCGDPVECDVDGSDRFLRKILITQKLLEPFEEPESDDSLLGTPSQLTHKLRRGRRAFKLLLSAVQHDILLTPVEEDQVNRLSGSTYHLEDE